MKPLRFLNICYCLYFWNIEQWLHCIKYSVFSSHPHLIIMPFIPFWILNVVWFLPWEFTYVRAYSFTLFFDFWNFRKFFFIKIDSSTFHSFCVLSFICFILKNSEILCRRPLQVHLVSFGLQTVQYSFPLFFFDMVSNFKMLLEVQSSLDRGITLVVSYP